MSDKQFYCSGRNNPIRNIVKVLIHACDKDVPFQKCEKRIGANADGKLENAAIIEYQNIHMVKSIPDHVNLMINNLGESIQPLARQLIQEMIDKGDFVTAKWIPSPPKDITKERNYYMPIIDTEWLDLKKAISKF